MRGAILGATAVVLSACGVSPPPVAQPRAVEAPAPAPAAPATVDPNPRVEPGLVAWHADFDAARAAAARSGKPVLLFAMLGDLDREFC